MPEVTINFPWPPKQLNPNFKRSNHWSKYQPQTKAYRKLCWGLTLEVTGTSPSFASHGVNLEITFKPPDRRKRDDDGMIGAFKAGRDGMADALGVDDNTFEPTYIIAEPVKGGCVVVRITPKLTTDIPMRGKIG